MSRFGRAKQIHRLLHRVRIVVHHRSDVLVRDFPDRLHRLLSARLRDGLVLSVLERLRQIGFKAHSGISDTGIVGCRCNIPRSRDQRVVSLLTRGRIARFSARRCRINQGLGVINRHTRRQPHA